MEIPLLNDVVIIFGIAIIVLFVCHRFHIPSIVGFLLTGIVAGPYGFALVKGVHDVEILAEVGIVLLLFTIGIEFSLKKLVQIRKAVLMGGSLQVLLTFGVTYFIVRQFGQAVSHSIFIGFLVVLSSTAIVLKIFQERAEMDSPQGRTTLGILIFQDIIIVPMMLITPLLTDTSGEIALPLLILLAKGIGIIFLVMLSAKWGVPQFLYQIARTRNQELFLISVVVICFGVAWLTYKAGLSLALGAFLAGLIISESEYSHQALGNILPFRDVFTTFFFVSIGMMLDINFLIQQPLVIILVTLGVLLLKSVIAGIVTTLLGYPFRTGVIVGFSLSQIGEFAFILSRTGVENGLLAGNTYQMFLSVSVLSMAATPFIIILAPRIADTILRLPLPKILMTGFSPILEEKEIKKKDHLIIIGYGVNGRNVASAARASGIPYAIIEMNPETVRSEQAKGEPICYGDSSQEPILQHAGIKNARVVVVAVNDPTTTRRISGVIRRLNAKVHLIVRTRYIQEMNPLYELGANEVIPEEFETSVEIFTRVLTKYLIPRDEIEKLVAEVRSHGYEMFRNLSKVPQSVSDIKSHLHNIEICTFQISEESPLLGESLAQSELRKRYGISIVAIRRNSKIITNPGADEVLQSKDVLFVFGSSEKIAKSIHTITSMKNTL